jgi:arylsulfatase
MRVRTTFVTAALTTSSLLVGLAASGGFPATAQAQDPSTQKSPTGGSPILPVPDAPFGGVIGRKAKESKPDFPKDVIAPKGAPNVLLIMTDDTGFGAPSTFGGPIPTPNLDRVAKTGLRYNQFHTTALCSPTRAAAGAIPAPLVLRGGGLLASAPE